MAADDARRPASLRVAGPARSVRRGDVPEEILARYVTDAARGRTVGFYTDARATRPAFRDRGDRLFADRNDPNAIRAMIVVAEHRGWSLLHVRGDESFRREVWVEAQRKGLDVRGYAPTTRDLQQEARRAPRRAEPHRGRKTRSLPPERRAQIVEAVLAARMLDPDRARRLLEAARARLAPVIAAIDRARDR